MIIKVPVTNGACQVLKVPRFTAKITSDQLFEVREPIEGVPKARVEVEATVKVMQH